MKTPTFGLIVVSAPSGTGKSTLCKRLLQEKKDAIQLSISTTTRKPRGQEKDGVDYFFVTNEVFQKKISDGEFAEWATVHGNFYGTERKSLESFWAKKKHVLLDIDVQGADSLKEAYPDRILSIFLSPPSLDELERRLRARGTESEEAIQTRLKNARAELDRKHDFDLILVNEELDRAYAELKNAVMRFTKELETGQWRKPQ